MKYNTITRIEDISVIKEQRDCKDKGGIFVISEKNSLKHSPDDASDLQQQHYEILCLNPTSPLNPIIYKIDLSSL